ncbi:hypothetical protein PR202_ga11800 [Eleusine coracana subsp. coracana]|uniref:SHSP domain-containing protein n=1 Tax=Eleusine coracana subsp. coracana TaxID=191504 RepID=A0AAV5CAJ4_ELECO|nr:hypothetical protein PR202_ga11800 [Eleusine coracana subsp. coracana]
MDQKRRRGGTTTTRVFDDFDPSVEWKTHDEAGAGAQEDVVEITLPGFRKDQVRVQVDDHGVLRATGERPVRAGRWARFVKDLRLPDNCDADAVRARFEGDRLFITLPITKDDVAPPGGAGGGGGAAAAGLLLLHRGHLLRLFLLILRFHLAGVRHCRRRHLPLIPSLHHHVGLHRHHLPSIPNRRRLLRFTRSRLHRAGLHHRRLHPLTRSRPHRAGLHHRHQLRPTPSRLHHVGLHHRRLLPLIQSRLHRVGLHHRRAVRPTPNRRRVGSHLHRHHQRNLALLLNTNRRRRLALLHVPRQHRHRLTPLPRRRLYHVAPFLTILSHQSVDLHRRRRCRRGRRRSHQLVPFLLSSIRSHAVHGRHSNHHLAILLSILRYRRRRLHARRQHRHRPILLLLLLHRRRLFRVVPFLMIMSHQSAGLHHLHRRRRVPRGRRYSHQLVPFLLFSIRSHAVHGSHVSNHHLALLLRILRDRRRLHHRLR